MTIYTDFSDIPRGRYECISADPAWKHLTWSAKGVTRRSPSHHYQTMSLAEIKALPVYDLASQNCHIFMWTTQPHLEVSFSILKAWGFKYSSVFKFWMKLNPRAADEMFLEQASFFKGTGYTTRKGVEPLLLGRRGSPKRLFKGEGDILLAARREHSRKPDAIFQIIERYCCGPRIELFAREERPGWDAWGNEVGKFPMPTEEVGHKRLTLLPVQPEVVGATEDDQDQPVPMLRFSRNA